MAAARQSRKSTDEEAVLPQTPPPANQGFGHGHGIDPGFIWQQLSEIQSKLGAIQATQQQHSAAIQTVQQQHAAALDKVDEKLSGKLSKIDADVTEFKQIRHTAKVVGWIVGIAAGSVLTLAGFIAKEAWTVLKPLAASAVQIQTSSPHSSTVAPPSQPVAPSVQK